MKKSRTEADAITVTRMMKIFVLNHAAQNMDGMDIEEPNGISRICSHKFIRWKG